jgi:hypothetical protein
MSPLYAIVQLVGNIAFNGGVLVDKNGLNNLSEI